MNPIFMPAFGGWLNTKGDNHTPARKPLAHVVSEKRTLWMNSDGQLKLTLAPQYGRALLEIRNGAQTLYRNRFPLQRGLHQSFDFSARVARSDQLRVVIGRAVIRKSIRITNHPKRTIDLYEWAGQSVSPPAWFLTNRIDGVLQLIRCFLPFMHEIEQAALSWHAVGRPVG